MATASAPDNNSHRDSPYGGPSTESLSCPSGPPPGPAHRLLAGTPGPGGLWSHLTLSSSVSGRLAPRSRGCEVAPGAHVTPAQLLTPSVLCHRLPGRVWTRLPVNGRGEALALRWTDGAFLLGTCRCAHSLLGSRPPSLHTRSPSSQIFFTKPPGAPQPKGVLPTWAPAVPLRTGRSPGTHRYRTWPRPRRICK